MERDKVWLDHQGGGSRYENELIRERGLVSQISREFWQSQRQEIKDNKIRSKSGTEK